MKHFEVDKNWTARGGTNEQRLHIVKTIMNTLEELAEQDNENTTLIPPLLMKIAMTIFQEKGFVQELMISFVSELDDNDFGPEGKALVGVILSTTLEKVNQMGEPGIKEFCKDRKNIEILGESIPAILDGDFVTRAMSKGSTTVQ